MSYVTHEWVVSHVNESCHIYTRNYTLADNNTLQHNVDTATHCITLQHTATLCNTLQHTYLRLTTKTDPPMNESYHTWLSHVTYEWVMSRIYTDLHFGWQQHTATQCKHCNTLQHTATHCITLQYAAIHCNIHTLWLTTKTDPHINESWHMWTSHVTYEWDMSRIYTDLPFGGQQHTASHCNTLQHAAIHCNRSTIWLII